MVEIASSGVRVALLLLLSTLLLRVKAREEIIAMNTSGFREQGILFVTGPVISTTAAHE